MHFKTKQTKKAVIKLTLSLYFHVFKNIIPLIGGCLPSLLTAQKSG